MTQVQNITESRSRKKGSHLSFQEMCFIEAWKKVGLSHREIARRLSCAPQTINNAIKNGIVEQVRRQKQNGKVYEYKNSIYLADVHYRKYQENRSRCGRRPKWLQAEDFLNWADNLMKHQGWSPDACVGHAKRLSLFPEKEIPSTNSLYNWIAAGLLKTKNIDLTEKVRRKPRGEKKVRRNKRVLGESIEKRPQEVENRDAFGHWELDTVSGTKSTSDPVLLTFVERKTRFELLVKLPSLKADAVDNVFKELFEEATPLKREIFKTFTLDNGSEFCGVSGLIEGMRTYFCHPYSAWERGTSENQHKLIRRFLKKGKSLQRVSQAQVKRIQDCMNHYPRKILNYKTAHECFIQEVQKICAVS